MAEVLESFDFDGLRQWKYPWDEWLDGQIRKLVPGDFHGKPVHFSNQVRAAALRRGLRVKTKIVGDSVVMQAFPNGKETP